jgi:hypothetical protein
MRRRAGALLIATLTAGALVAGLATEASAGGKKAKAPVCKGKTKKKAIKAIEVAYDHFLNGAENPDAATDKAPYIQYMSDPDFSQSLYDAFLASSEANAAAAATTSVAVNKVTCTGKKTAEVEAELVLNGTEAPGIFPNPGEAVLQGKVRKVAGTTFCNLTGVGDASALEPPHPCADVVLGDDPADAGEAEAPA